MERFKYEKIPYGTFCHGDAWLRRHIVDHPHPYEWRYPVVDKSSYVTHDSF